VGQFDLWFDWMVAWLLGWLRVVAWLRLPHVCRVCNLQNVKRAAKYFEY
jgi:hypothetical protein